MTAAATLGVAGCTVFSPPTVLKTFDPSDGVGTSLEGVDIRNVLLVSSGVDQPGVLSAVLVNSNAAAADVEVSVDVDAGSPTTQTFSVAQSASLHIGDPSAAADGASVDGESSGQQAVGWMQVPQVPVVPGQTVPVTFTVNGKDAEVNAQVLRPCFEYATITPTAPAAEPSGTASATASASATPSTSVTCGPETGPFEQSEDGAS